MATTEVKKDDDANGKEEECIFIDFLADEGTNDIAISKLRTKSEVEFLRRKEVTLMLRQVSGCGFYQVYVFLLTF